MKTIKLTDEQWEAWQAGEALTIKAPSKKVQRFEPEVGDRYYLIVDGEVTMDAGSNHPSDIRTFNHFNVFETIQQAKQVAKWQRQFNAIAMACSLVNKDTEDEEVFRLYKSSNGWDSLFWDIGFKHDEPYVSTQEQANQAIALLKSWGV